MHVQGVEVAEDIGNLDRVIGDPDNPDPNRPFLLMGRAGTLARHGYGSADRLIGKRCLIYSGGRFDTVAIESDRGDEWPLVVWTEYVGIRFTDQRSKPLPSPPCAGFFHRSCVALPSLLRRASIGVASRLHRGCVALHRGCVALYRGCVAPPIRH